VGWTDRRTTDDGNMARSTRLVLLIKSSDPDQETSDPDKENIFIGSDTLSSTS